MIIIYCLRCENTLSYLKQRICGGQTVILVVELHFHGGALGHHQLLDGLQSSALVEVLPVKPLHGGGRELGRDVVKELDRLVSRVRHQHHARVEAEELGDGAGVGLRVRELQLLFCIY